MIESYTLEKEMPTETNGPGQKKKTTIRCTPVNLDTQAAIRRFQAEFMTTAEAAAQLGLTINTMQKYCQDGIFTNSKIFGGEWVISRYDLDWWKLNRQGKRGRPRAGE